MSGPQTGTGLKLQGLNSNDDLTNFIRSIEGLTGTQGQGMLNSGVSALGPVLSQLTALSKGDQGDVAQAAQPQIDQIGQQFDAIRNMVSLQPRGGGKTTALAEAPFEKSAAIQRTEGDMKTGATGQLAGIGTNLINAGSGLESESANIGLTKEGQNYSQKSRVDQAAEMITALLQ